MLDHTSVVHGVREDNQDLVDPSFALTAPHAANELLDVSHSRLGLYADEKVSRVPIQAMLTSVASLRLTRPEAAR